MILAIVTPFCDCVLFKSCVLEYQSYEHLKKDVYHPIIFVRPVNGLSPYTDKTSLTKGQHHS